MTVCRMYETTAAIAKCFGLLCGETEHAVMADGEARTYWKPIQTCIQDITEQRDAATQTHNAQSCERERHAERHNPSAVCLGEGDSLDAGQYFRRR